ncbi:D-alanine--D-alanine ligase [Candidatus Poribacteria bacterium]
MSRKINVAVLMGGRTAEHEVSLGTGRVIVNALDKNEYNVKPIIITKTGEWLIHRGYIRQLEGAEEGFVVEDVQKPDIVPLSTGMALDKTMEEKVDVVFVAMHGPLGEDGTVQGLLELADIPYTGSNVLSSSLAMHKVTSRQLFQHNGLNVPRSLVFGAWEWEKSESAVISKVEAEIGFPCVLKPLELGSSVGISIAKTEAEFRDDFQTVLRYSNEVLVEEFLEGPEVTCAVLGAVCGEEPTALVPTQIVPVTSEFFDYEAKYTPGATEEITPPRDMSDEMLQEIQETAVRAHKILSCGGMSRTDMIIRNDVLYVLELNTIPGMTEVSLYPQAAKAAGMKFPELLSRIIQLAIEAHKLKKQCTDTV